MTREEYLKLDIVDRLKLWRDNSVDVPWFIPGEYPPDMIATLSYAIAEIERLRAVDVMPTPYSQDDTKLATHNIPPAKEQRHINPDYAIKPTDSFDDIKRKIHPGRRTGP